MDSEGQAPSPESPVLLPAENLPEALLETPNPPKPREQDQHKVPERSDRHAGGTGRVQWA